MAGRTERRAGSSSKRGKPHSAKRKNPTGGAPSLRQDNAMERAHQQPRTGPRAEERTFNLIVDDVPYVVKAAPFSFNNELRFHVSINAGPEHIFTWDSELKSLRAIDDDASILPDSVEEAISQRLQSKER